MRKIVKKGCQIVVLTLVLCSLFVIGAGAEAKAGETLPQSGVEDVLSEFESLLPEEYAELSDHGAIADAVGFDRLVKIISDGVLGRGSELLSFLLLLVGSVILICLTSVLTSDRAPLCRGAVGVVTAVAVFSRLFPLVSEITETLRRLSGFFGSLIPLLATVNTMGGNVSSASTQALGMTLTMQLYGSLGASLSLVVGGVFAVGMLSGLGGGFASVGRAVKGFFGRGMGVFTALLAGTLSLQTLLTGVSDSTAMRVARYAISGTVPIVGGAVSAALSTLVGGLSYAKGVIGGGAVLVLSLMAAVPLVILLLYKLCMFISLTLLDFASGGEGGECLSAISGGLDALISVYVMTSVIFIFQVILFIMGGIALE